MLSLLAIHSPVINAQQLEEIVVTAQRREQSIQEVPISIETFTGAQITKQGYRDLDALASLLPGVVILPQQNDTVITIRGFGTTGNSLTLEQATPIFLDGIHYGRASQAKAAFLDVERIEVLKGPQPIFFGNNATAGAFNIQSRKPTPTWEGNVNAEVGNNATQEISFGVGGPITDTWGVRLAGKYETTAGYLKDAIDETSFPHQTDYAGRVTLQWTPTENFQATSKLEKSRIRAGSEGKLICLTGQSLVFTRKGPTKPGDEGEPFSVWRNAPLGEGTDIPHLPIPRAGGTNANCWDSNVTRSNEGPYYDVPTNIRQTAANSGMLDIREVGQAYLNDTSDPIIGPPNAFSTILGHEWIDSTTATMDLAYQFDNGVEVDWLSGFSKFDRETSEENFDSPFFENNQIRHQNFDQWSSELRFTSEIGGTIEWMGAFFWQDTTYDIATGNLRATVRRGVRMNRIWEDVIWKSAFGNVTFNFLDNKASLDLGGRISDIDKLTFAGGYGAQWIVNEEPELGSPGGYVQADPATDGSRIYLPFNAAAGLWYYPFRKNRTVPENWKGTVGANVVGLTAPDFGTPDQGPHGPESFGGTEFDPQVVLRYRPTENHSLYARWAQSFKSGGFDTGQTSIPRDIEDFSFTSENSETYEVGSKGFLFDNRVRYDLAIFQLTFKDLQLQSQTGNLDDPNANINAGKQRVRGVEFGFDWAATENLTVNLAGSIMDGKMVDFFNSGCTRVEVVTPGSGCTVNADGDNVIDRTGQQAPYTPDWNFVLGVDYVYPVFDNYQFDFNARGYISDKYFTDSSGFTKVVSWDTNGDANVAIGFGDQDGSWRASLWARNILEAHEKYHPELDPALTAKGSFGANVSPGNFMTFGAKFEYYYR
jgi:outer membrane receptor protein involved in Fe transport